MTHVYESLLILLPPCKYSYRQGNETSRRWILPWLVPFLPKLSSFLTSRFSGFVSLRRPVRRERVKKREKDLQNPEVPRMNKELWMLLPWQQQPYYSTIDDVSLFFSEDSEMGKEEHNLITDYHSWRNLDLQLELRLSENSLDPPFSHPFLFQLSRPVVMLLHCLPSPAPMYTMAGAEEKRVFGCKENRREIYVSLVSTNNRNTPSKTL